MSDQAKGIQAARDRQKSYAGLKSKPMEFQVGDRVMIKVSPWKGVVHFGKREKLNPRYVRPFQKCYSDEPLAVPVGIRATEKSKRFIAISRLPLVKVAGTLGEVLSYMGKRKIPSKRNTHISSQIGHLHPLQRLKP
ncbi:hypothetical protein Tco_1509164 [Tanacetum coccineum]